MLFGFFFFYSIEGPRIHQSGIAAVPGRQFRVRVLHPPHHRLPVHREPEQQLHITSSHSGAPHQQPQRAVVEFQWMVRVNAFKRATAPPSPKKDSNLRKERELFGLFKVSRETWTGKKDRRPVRSIIKANAWTEKGARTLSLTPPPLLYFPFLLRDFLERYLQKSHAYLRAWISFCTYEDFTDFRGGRGKV